MSARAFAANLGTTVVSATSWEQRGERTRLRHAEQKILGRDSNQASDDVRDGLEATRCSVAATSTHDDARRMEPLLAYSSAADLATAGYLRGKVTELDAEYDRAPSVSLHGTAGQPEGQRAFLLTRIGDSRVQREVIADPAESAVLMGQSVCEVSRRRDHAAAMFYFDATLQPADSCGNRVAACPARKTRS